jgi:DNA-binding NarL/FixJ family response regulator
VLHITPWECSALQSLAAGLSTAQLAISLGLSESDIEQRLAALYSRMGAASHNDAISVASRRGLIPNAPGRDGSRL